MRADEATPLLRRMMAAAIAAADPGKVLVRHLPDKPKGRCIIVGAGKSAAAMAKAVEEAWPDVEISGVVVTRYGHSVPTRRIVVRESSHPVPDAAGMAAAREIRDAARSAGPDDLVLALISGGGSALMPMPVAPLTLDDKIAVNRLLLHSGLTIRDMNKVRRRLSVLKGGGLAKAAAPARLVTLAISDIPGDHPADIASGPTIPDPSAAEDLSKIADLLGPSLPDTVRTLLGKTVDDPTDFHTDYRMIAAPQMSLIAAAEAARSAGVTPVLLGDALEGEARQLGIFMAGVAASVATHDAPARPPAVLLSGGETTVSIGDTTPGRGGRNTEFLLSLALALDGKDGVLALAVDTDGIDGTEDAAGAIIDPTTLTRAISLGLNPSEYLARHDSYSLFDSLGDLIRTGPTLTNVNDFRAVLVL